MMIKEVKPAYCSLTPEIKAWRKKNEKPGRLKNQTQLG